MPNLKHPQINSLVISGRLTANPEVKPVGTDSKVCNTSIAVDLRWQEKKKTMFLDCTAWGKTAEIIGELHTGSPVILEGFLNQDEWEDKKTGDKKTKMTMTVNRVHSLAWDDDQVTDRPTTTNVDDLKITAGNMSSGTIQSGAGDAPF